MASNINPNNIDGAYPVAGQDNDSQGFRDNFTNIKTNFQYAEDEITDLQNKAILKSALAGTTLNNDMGGSLLYNFQTQDVSQTVVNQGTVSGSVTVDYSAGSVQAMSSSGSISFNLTNWPAGGIFGELRITLTITSTSHTVTFPSSVTGNRNSIVGWNATTNVWSPPSTGNFIFALTSRDGGTNYLVRPESVNLMVANAGEEDLANAAAASLVATTSYFTTTSAETATLASGVNGQVKTFAMFGDGGDMVITVTNAGWKSSGTGTITFDTIGDACSLQYINGKWFCIGNNGCTFA